MMFPTIEVVNAINDERARRYRPIPRLDRSEGR